MSSINRIRFLNILLLALMLTLASVSIGCGNGKQSQTDQLAKESEDLRMAAMSKYLQSVAGIDNIVTSASKGISLPVNQIITTTGTTETTLNIALSDLTTRGDKLTEAMDTNPGDNYQHYLSLMRSNNDKLTEAFKTRLSIALLIGSEPYRLAGWDEIRAKEIVEEAQFMQKQEAISYNDAEVLRNQAEQIKNNNPEEFGDF